MPELPEVEVTRRQIEPALVGRRITRVETTQPSYFFLTPPRVLRVRLRGRVVRHLDRVGKYLVATLDDRSRVLLHLGMTGQLRVVPGAKVRDGSAGARGAVSRDPHTHLVLGFAGRGTAIQFRDARKFGKVQWLAPGVACERLDRLGADALHARTEHLYRATRRKRAAVKSVLLDQAVVAGVGNIYADEALFLARVRPPRAAGRLTRAECERLTRAVRAVLRRAIRAGGSTISDYVRPDGSGGGYQDAHRVYGHAGEPCPACGARIRRVVIGARSSCYCPACQR
jgi:formamidopyrimidine-DNA glycosylase